MSSLVNKKVITLARQKSDLLSTFHQSICTVKGDNLYWEGNIQPTPLSKVYNVLILYHLNHYPRIEVFIKGDNLKKLDDPDFPHKYKIYKDKNAVKICLDRYQQFNKYCFISNTIIPWVIEWLYYYEIWLATGDWLGGGEHPGKGEAKKEVY